MRRRTIIVAAGALLLVIAVLCPALIGYLRIRAERACLEELLVANGRPFRQNIGLVKTGMEKAKVEELLGRPHLRSDDPPSDLYVFAESIDWGQSYYNINGDMVSVDYAADAKTVETVEVRRSGSLHCDTFTTVTFWDYYRIAFK